MLGTTSVHVLTLVLLLEPPASPRSSPAGLGEPGRWGVPIWICAPIDSAFEHRVHTVLQLSDAQEVFCHGLLTSLAAQDAEFRSRRLEKLREQSFALGERRNLITSDPDVAQQNAAFVSECHGFIEELTKIEEGLFAQLDTALSEDQRLKSAQLRSFRQRQRWMVFPYWLFAAEIDLADLWNDLDASRPLQMTDPAALEFMMGNYEQAMNQLARKRFEGRLESMERTPVLVALNSSGGSADEQASRQQEMRRLKRSVHAAEKRMRDLNNTYVGLLADQLESADAGRLKDAFRERAYPEVWPNPFDAKVFFETISNYVPAKRRDDYERIVADWTTTSESLTLAMKNRVDRWVDQLSSTGNENAVEFDAYKTDLDKLQNRRKEQSERAILELRQVFGDRAPKAFDQAVFEFDELSKNRRGRQLRYSYIP